MKESIPGGSLNSKEKTQKIKNIHDRWINEYMRHYLMTIESKDKKIHSKVVNALDIVGSDFRAYKNGYSGEYNVNKNVVDTLSGSLLQYIQEIRANLREYEGIEPANSTILFNSFFRKERIEQGDKIIDKSTKVDLNKLQTISLDHQKLEEIDITKLYSRIKQIFAEIIKNTLATEDKGARFEKATNQSRVEEVKILELKNIDQNTIDKLLSNRDLEVLKSGNKRVATLKKLWLQYYEYTKIMRDVAKVNKDINGKGDAESILYQLEQFIEHDGINTASFYDTMRGENTEYRLNILTKLQEDIHPKKDEDKSA